MELTLDQALQKGIEAHKAGQVQDADRYYTAILKADPKHPDANHNMGVLAVGVGKVQEALPFFKTALEVNPNIAQFWLSYIDALIKLDQIADAKDVLEQAKSNGANGDAFDQLEKRLASIGKDQEPTQTQVQTLIDLYSQGQHQETIHQASQLLVQFPNSINLYNIMGVTFREQGRLEKAIEAYKKAISIKPDYADAYNNMGNALKDQGKLEEAIEAYSKACSIKTDHADAHYNMGLALQDQGKPEEAIEAYKNALSLKPDNADAYNNLGVALQDQGKLGEVIGAYKKALSIKPDYAEAYYNMGVALKDQGKLEEAIEAYSKAISIKPDYAEAWNNLYFPLRAIKTKTSPDKKINFLFSKDIESNYAKIELDMLDYKLHRGKENEDIYLDNAISRLSIIENRTIANLKFDKNTKRKIFKSPKMVSLVHFGRSGTGLMHSLIDGHPEVSTLPSIYFSEYFNHSTWVKITSAGWDGMTDRFMAMYDVLFDATSPVPIEGKSKVLFKNIGINDGMANVGDQKNEVLKVDKDIFRSELKRLMASYEELDSFIFFELVHVAYNRALNDLNSKNLIFYHIHNPDTYAQLNFVRSNPTANWLLMVREPIQSLESWIGKAFSEKDHFGVTNRILTMLFELDNSIYKKQRSIGVRLEDLKNFPRQTIPALCKWIGIAEEDSLYEMTAQGKKWWGDPNSPDYEKDGQEPFGKTSIKRQVGSIFSENDQFILRTLFYPFSVRFGYTEENENKFQKDLKKIKPLIEEIFDFEKKLLDGKNASFETFMETASYLYLRSGLTERWNTLNKYQTYPDMIWPLKI